MTSSGAHITPPAGRFADSWRRRKGKDGARSHTAIVVEWLLISLFSLILMAAIYPDMILFAEVRFTSGHDILIPFQAAFYHASYFIGEGAAIWNPFDQVNHSHLHLGTGFHTFPSIVEGFAFSLIHSWFDRPGEAFQAFHSVGFFLICILVRSAGGTALLNLYPVSQISRIVALVAMNTLLAHQTYTGLMAGFLYSLTPLVLYFIIRFLRRLSLANFLWLFVIFGFAFAQVPLLSLAYFYLPIHQFIVCALIAFAYWHRQARRAARGKGAAAEPRPRSSSRTWALALSAGIVCVVIVLAANFSYLVLMVETISLHGSGLAGSEGRFDKIFDRLDFIKHGGSGPDLAVAFGAWVDFTRNDWWKSWSLIGASCLGLSLVGTLCGGHRERWLFALGFVLAVLVQIPRSYISFGLPAHYITSLTNPFAFLIRNSHMSIMLIGYFLVPLIAFGGDVLQARLAPADGRFARLRDGLAVALLLAATGYCLASLALVPGLVTAGIFAALAAGLIGVRLNPGVGAAVALIPAAVLAADLLGYSAWLKEVDYTGDRIMARTFEGLVTAGSLDANPIVLDYANPATRHFPLFVRTGADPVAPTTDPEFPTDFAVYFIRQVYMGKFFETIFMARHLNPLHLYEIRHKRYAEVPSNPALARLLADEERLYYFVPVGVTAANVTIEDLQAAGAAKWAVSLALPDNGKAVAEIADQLPGAPPPYERRDAEAALFFFEPAEGLTRQRDGFTEFAFDLPPGFPPYLATTVLSADALRVRAFLGDRELAPAQGHLIRPYSFDVRNVATDKLVVALPTNPAPGDEVRVEVLLDPLITAVHKESDDLISVDVTAPENGWLVLRHPLDDGWSARANGQAATILAANRTSMAVAVEKGKSTIVLEYAGEGRYAPFKWMILALLPALPLLGFIVTAAALFLPLPSDQPRPGSAHHGDGQG